MTCGRHSAMASATAREPSVCLSIHRLLRLARNAERFRRGADILLGERAWKFLANGFNERRQLDHAGNRSECSEEGHVRHRATHMLQRKLGGRKRAQSILLDPPREPAQTDFVKTARRVDQ